MQHNLMQIQDRTMTQALIALSHLSNETSFDDVWYRDTESSGVKTAHTPFLTHMIRRYGLIRLRGKQEVLIRGIFLFI
jgi:hypothetical protein